MSLSEATGQITASFLVHCPYPFKVRRRSDLQQRITSVGSTVCCHQERSDFVSESTPPRRYIDSQTRDGRCRLLVEAVTDYAIYMLGPDGIITSWNPGAERLEGYTDAETIGQHRQIWIHAVFCGPGLQSSRAVSADAVTTFRHRLQGMIWRSFARIASPSRSPSRYKAAPESASLPVASRR